MSWADPERARRRARGKEDDEERRAAEGARQPCIDRARRAFRRPRRDRTLDRLDDAGGGVVDGQRPEDEDDDREADDLGRAPDLEEQVLDRRGENQRRKAEEHADQADPAVPEPEPEPVEKRKRRPAEAGRPGRLSPGGC